MSQYLATLIAVVTFIAAVLGIIGVIYQVDSLRKRLLRVIIIVFGAILIISLLINSLPTLIAQIRISQASQNSGGSSVTAQGNPTSKPKITPTPNLAPGDEVEIYTRHGSAIDQVGWSPDEKYIASLSEDETLQVWEPFSGKLIAKINIKYASESGLYSSFSWSPDSRYIAFGNPGQINLDVSELHHNAIEIWDIATNSQKLTVDGGNSSENARFSWSPDGKHIACVKTNQGNPDVIEIWDVTNNSQTLKISSSLQSPTVANVGFSPNGKYLAVTETKNNSTVSNIDYTNDTVEIFDAISGTKLLTSAFNNSPLYIPVQLIWSPDNKHILFDPNPTVILSIDTGQHISLAGSQDMGLEYSWSSDGKYIAGGFDDYVIVYDAHSGNILRKYDADMRSHEGISVEWSPDNKYIAGTHHNDVLEWDTGTGKIKLIFSGHTAYANCFAWSPDSKYIASGGQDNAVRVWKA